MSRTFLVGLAALGSLLFLPAAHAAAPKKSRTPKSDPAVQSATTGSQVNWGKIVADVNGEPITMGQLAAELVEVHGKEQLELMIHRKLVEQACRERKIDVTRQDIEEELDQKLRQLNLSRREFIERVLDRRNMTLAQYVRDTIWPSVALSRLVGAQVQVTNEDLTKAFEANYGEKVDCRMLIVRERRKAEVLWQQLQEAKDPKTGQILDLDARVKLFEGICMSYSIDEATRPYGGRCQPIHRHSSFPEIEATAFALEPGQFSAVCEVPQGFLVLLCVQRIPAQPAVTLDSPFDQKSGDTVRQVLHRDIHQKKLRQEIATYFQKTLETAKINDYLSGDFDPDTVQPTGHSQPRP